MTRGYAVLCIPETGLYYRNGSFESRDGRPIKVGEILIFARLEDAENNAIDHEKFWNKDGHKWSFPVIPVDVKERA